MIVDQLENLSQYEHLNQGFAKAFGFLQECLNGTIENGKHIIDGDKIYANVQTYTTKTSAELEAHRRYIDIQCILLGEEIIEYSAINELEISKTYDDQNDIVFFKDKGMGSKIHMKKGCFAIFFPQDAHKPCMKIKQEENVQKIVIKVKV